MSPGAYTTFATVFGLTAFGHALLAWIKWRQNSRRWSAGSKSGRASFNYLVAAAVFFTGVAAYCAALG